MKKIAILSATTLLIGSCASAAFSDEMDFVSQITPAQNMQPAKAMKNVLITLPTHRYDNGTMLERIAMDYQKEKNILAEKARVVALHKAIIQKRIKSLKKHVNKTRYVFSGSTPRGWDCSGLVVWFYKDLGIEIPHSATKQGKMKPKVKKPIPGDIVVTKYKNSKNFIHSGIYIGNNKMIHSGFKPGQRTEVINLNDPSFDNQRHYFVRVIGD